MIHLHVHSSFSFLDGFGTPEQIAERAAELKAPAIALTDHGSITGHILFWKACEEHGVKPIFGAELYVVEDIHNNTRFKGHMTVLAKNLDGYRNLLSLMSLAHSEGHFYYRPTVDLSELIDRSDGLIVSTGCMYGLIPSAAIAGDEDKAESMIVGLHEVFRDDFFLEVQPFDIAEVERTNRFLVKMSKKHSIPLLATGDVHYPRAEDAKIQHTLLAIRLRQPQEDTYKSEPIQYQTTEEEMLELFSKHHPYHDWADAVKVSDEIASRCDVTLPTAPPLRFSQDPDEDRLALFRSMINDGWEKRGITDDDDETYAKRVQYEYDIIVKKDYYDYFLVVADIIQWAKGNNILVGSGRGSAAGSLICYLLGITEIDPIPYDLIFERFIDITRPDPPDVDIDFEDRYREDVKNYIRDKYGEDCVANLSAYVTFKGKNSLDDVARIEGVPAYEVAKIKAVLVERSSGDSRASFTIEDTCEEFPQAKDVLDKHPELKAAMALEGQAKGMTIHAAGMVVCNEPLSWYTVILRDGQTAINHKDAAKIGLLKIDILGIATLSVVHRCAEAVGISNDDLYKLPLDDPLVFEGFNEGFCHGIFQWEGRSTQSVTRQIAQKGGISSFEQLIDINTLSRPGPLNSGATTKYVDNKLETIHPAVDKLTLSTRGQVLYQEQVMMIMREVGMMDWKDTADIRKLISKKEGVERFNTYWEKFKKGAIKQGLPEQKAKMLWERVCTFGAYAFNKSHSVSYALLAYQTMYLKMHHPLEFYWSCLVQEPRDTGIIREFMRRGGTVLPVRVGKSKAEWTIEGDALRAGFMSIKDVGEKTAVKLEQTGQVGGKARQALAAAGAFSTDDEDDDFLGLKSFEDRIKKSGAKHRIGDLGFEGASLVTIAGIVKDRNLRSMEEFARSILKSDKPITHPELDQWVTLLVEDDTGYIHCNIDRFMYPKMKGEVWEDFEDGDIYLIKGTKEAGTRRVKVKRIENWSKRHETDEERSGPGRGSGQHEQLALFDTPREETESPAVPRPRSDHRSSDSSRGRPVPRMG